MKTNNDEHEFKLHMLLTWVAALGFAIVLAGSYIYWFGVRNGVPLSVGDAAPWGAFGDFMGGLLNPFVAGCALYWLARSVRMQQQELSETKKELAESRAAQQNQAVTLDKQRFEDTFFSLLTQHNEVLNRFTSANSPMGNESSAYKINKEIQVKAATLHEANVMLGTHDDTCGHYFRILYQLLKLVATRCPATTLEGPFTGNAALASIAHPDEKLYTNIVRAFLNVEVTQLLAINCYCEDDSTYWEYKGLVERYSFLEHMPFEYQMVGYPALREAHRFYEHLAFGKSEFVGTL